MSPFAENRTQSGFRKMGCIMHHGGAFLKSKKHTRYIVSSMESRTKKDGKIFNCYLSSEIFDLLEKYSIKTGLTKTMITERAIKQYLGSMKKEKERS